MSGRSPALGYGSYCSACRWRPPPPTRSRPAFSILHDMLALWSVSLFLALPPRASMYVRRNVSLPACLPLFVCWISGLLNVLLVRM